jgi:predicted O-methyltransferase YrrM
VKNIRLTYKYLAHLLTARNTRGHGVHSPFMFNFIRYVLEEKHAFYIFKHIERVRKAMLVDSRMIDVTDFGTGKSGERKVADIAEKALKKPELAQLLFRTISHFGCKYILELGTSLGISTMYMASVSSKSQCITIEGCSELANIARQNFDKLGLKQIKLINSNIDEQLGNILTEYGQQDFIFIDANHRFEPLMHYFEICLNHIGDNSIIVVDDIYWSPEMEAAWKVIKENPRVKSTIDIFHMGFVFFNPILTKKHYKVK